MRFRSRRWMASLVRMPVRRWEPASRRRPQFAVCREESLAGSMALYIEKKERKICKRRRRYRSERVHLLARTSSSAEPSCPFSALLLR